MPYCTLTDIEKMLPEIALIQLTNDAGIGSDNAGDTDGSTAVITGMADTSFLLVGDYVTVSAGFSTTGPFRILSKTTDSIELDTNSNSAKNNVVISNAVNQTIIDEAIAQADAEIDGYIANRYVVPFVVVPGILRKFSTDMAIYNLYARKVEEIPETRQTRYDNAIRMLRDISAGKASIDDGEEESGTYEVRMESGTRKFTRDKMKGF